MDLGKILVLDVLVNNADRHAGNLLLQPDPDESAIKLWAIDAGDALIGYPADYASARQELPSPRNLARGLPVQEVLESVRDAAEVAGQLPEADVSAMVDEACELAREPHHEPLKETLIWRCAHARALADRYITQIGPTR